MGEGHKVELLPGGFTFECDGDTRLLDAAIMAGLNLPYGCRKGNCGTCKAQVLDGEVDLEIESIYSLSDFERDQGYTLLCSAYALSDLVLEMDGLDIEEAACGTRPKIVNGEVEAVWALTHDIRLLEVTLEQDLEFQAGQFAQVNSPGTGVWRSYSMANAPSEPRCARFMIKLVPGGHFSSQLSTLEPGTAMSLEAPHGSFWVRDGERPLLMVGGGAGMAPLWSMLQDLVQRGDRRPVRFFYGARRTEDLFYLEQIRRLGGDLADFQFITALSEGSSGSANGHEEGLVSDVVGRRLGRDIASFDAYLCGPPPMIDAVIDVLHKFGLDDRKRIFFDKFSAS